MQPFTTLTAIAAPLPLINVDTDMIIPKQFLRTIKRTGLGKHLFDEMRHDAAGHDIPDFVLNRPPYTEAQILVTGSNFGCGSSREHAPWALLDFGIRCIIAPSYADIFFNNCFKNGILPIVLEQEYVDALMKEAQAQNRITVDLAAQTIQSANTPTIPFTIEPFRKHCLLHGLDDIGLTLEKEADIRTYEAANRQERPWLYKSA
jgi:3-isopropylmalate/(R)-2-methylmalate dehydratase small subunit